MKSKVQSIPSGVKLCSVPRGRDEIFRSREPLKRKSHPALFVRRLSDHEYGG
jgi:hypothetical protein